MDIYNLEFTAYHTDTFEEFIGFLINALFVAYSFFIVYTFLMVILECIVNIILAIWNAFTKERIKNVSKKCYGYNVDGRKCKMKTQGNSYYCRHHER